MRSSSKSFGKFIVIEGGDSAGKHTQAELLFKHLQMENNNIELLSFPQYGTPFGDLVAKYLLGEYGNLDELPTELPCLLYALDRYQVKEKLISALAAGRWLISDRYTQSNLGHQGAKLAGDERKKLIAWVEAMESRLPQPELVIYLHVPADIAWKLMETREHKSYMPDGENQDIHELDPSYQQRVVETYLELAEARDNWVVIDCIDRNTGELRKIDDIHQELVKIVRERFN